MEQIWIAGLLQWPRHSPGLQLTVVEATVEVKVVRIASNVGSLAIGQENALTMVGVADSVTGMAVDMEIVIIEMIVIAMEVVVGVAVTVMIEVVIAMVGVLAQVETMVHAIDIVVVALPGKMGIATEIGLALMIVKAVVDMEVVLDKMTAVTTVTLTKNDTEFKHGLKCHRIGCSSAKLKMVSGSQLKNAKQVCDVYTCCLGFWHFSAFSCDL